MKKILFVSALLLVGAASVLAQKVYPTVNVHDLQFVSQDSLNAADVLQNTIPARWPLQKSPTIKAVGSLYKSDTVTVVGLVVAPAKTVTYTRVGWSMILADTSATPYPWGGLLVRVDNSVDTNSVTGFLNPQRGDIIKMTGFMAEFPAGVMNSTSQFSPIANSSVEIIGSKPLPKPVPLTAGTFGQGIFPANKVLYSTGEQYEGCYVELTNLVVDARTDTGRGQFSMVDPVGNQVTMYDYSRYFTKQGTSVDHPAADTQWVRLYPQIGTVVDTIRGIITTVSGQNSARGYQIAPLYYGDVVFGKSVRPAITTHRRNPIVVSPDSVAAISVKAFKQKSDALGFASVKLYYSLNNGPFTQVAMTGGGPDSTWTGSIPTQTANTFVKYFIQGIDSAANVVTYANSASSSISTDTSKGFFFYTVLNRSLTIQDVQYTPYLNGRSPYIGAVVSMSGIITADTSKISLSPGTTGSTNAWYIQSTNLPWSGLWLTTSDTTTQKAMAALRNGDSVTVTGTVQEQFDVTRLGNITSVVKVSSGNPEPAPVVRPTVDFSAGNGIPSAEKYEGMLVRFLNVTVISTNPTYSDPTEYLVTDGTGAVVVQQSGKNRYSNAAADSISGKTILNVGTRIGALNGIVYYSFNQYKFVPRTDADFTGVILSSVAERIGSDVPGSYVLTQNYPNPFNPSTVIQYALPRAGMTMLRVYNILGQEVATLVNEYQAPGTYTVRFDASSLSSGVYFFRVQSGSFSAVKKMMLVK